MFAQIVSGEVDWADFFFLLAAILFAIGAFLTYPVKTLWATLVAAGLCFVAIGWLVL